MPTFFELHVHAGTVNVHLSTRHISVAHAFIDSMNSLAEEWGETETKEPIPPQTGDAGRIPADQARSAEVSLLAETAEHKRTRRTKAQIAADDAAALAAKNLVTIEAAVAAALAAKNLVTIEAAVEPEQPVVTEQPAAEDDATLLASLLGEGDSTAAATLTTEPPVDIYGGWTLEQARAELKLKRVERHGLPWLRSEMAKVAARDKKKISYADYDLSDVLDMLRSSDKLTAEQAT